MAGEREEEVAKLDGASSRPLTKRGTSLPPEAKSIPTSDNGVP